ncbi:hypothetical protein FDP41_006426 [Naegleria fowleri]|uniref:Uncharacterized protein n=1 Tax=Naegleria fowleri TaxID=5763 RepID=A0A6A5BK18_NAEFO|nr:uncharacterized protein FDP41_006426 [Naegleria fowleri]KAF0974394.1 hypothetical protein FDP41_006426 [Naegleria fowleri]CAG4719394.1 unnamed protein product [Naegleria fowleri]
MNSYNNNNSKLTSAIYGGYGCIYFITSMLMIFSPFHSANILFQQTFFANDMDNYTRIIFDLFRFSGMLMCFLGVLLLLMMLRVTDKKALDVFNFSLWLLSIFGVFISFYYFILSKEYRWRDWSCFTIFGFYCIKCALLSYVLFGSNKRRDFASSLPTHSYGHSSGGFFSSPPSSSSLWNTASFQSTYKDMNSNSNDYSGSYGYSQQPYSMNTMYGSVGGGGGDLRRRN